MKRMLYILISLITFFGCTKATIDDNKSYTVKIGVYLLVGNSYVDQNKDLIFITQAACQSWTRTAQPDIHNSATHKHFNAAKNTTYDIINESITWAEYGPELDQASIDATCNAGINGVVKSANKNTYTSIQKFYLKIKSVVEI